MVLTSAELIDLLKNEVRILVHLAGKVEPHMVEYRPTPKQRSTLELLQYMTIMGPNLVKAVFGGGFDTAAWTAADTAAKARNFEQTVAALQAQAAEYEALLGNRSDADYRVEIDMFGHKASRGAHITYFVLGGHAAYRTQLFLYLKSCGREELSTMNLWAGMDAPAATV
jgi:hypothetical protein